jgi:hypothetical protein
MPRGAGYDSFALIAAANTLSSTSLGAACIVVYALLLFAPTLWTVSVCGPDQCYRACCPSVIPVKVYLLKHSQLLACLPTP